MKRIALLLLMSGFSLCLFTADNFAQRRGGGGGRGGYGGGGGFTAPARTMSANSGSSFQSVNRASGSGPAGGSWQAASGSGSHTTKNGATINYKGAAVGGSGPGGVSGGKYIGGVSITTPGGQTVGTAGKGGAVVGPNGNAVAGKSRIAATSGPMGTGVAASRSGIAVGPNGAAGFRTGAAVTSHGTYYRSAAAVSGQGVYVRAGCHQYHNCFTPAWCARYPAVWYPPRWVAATAWTAVTWAALSSTCGYPAESSINYDYGSTVVYQDNSVYVNGEKSATAEEYANQASTIAQTGKQAQANKDENWTPLGVFAMVMGEETNSYNIFQLAINQDGVLRGNYYNALTDSTEPVYGAVDKKTQRAAWTVGDKKSPTYEAGIVNMTQDNATMMVHYSKDRSQQMTLVKIQQTDEANVPAKDGN